MGIIIGAFMGGIGIWQLIVILIIFFPLIIGALVMGPQKSIKVEHKESGIGKNIFIGYSWTYFLFGFFVPIFRGEIVIGVFHLIFSIVTFGVFQLIMPFLYNKQYSHRMLNSSWILSDSEEKINLAKLKLNIKH